jgi:DNA-binding HxlR family transcriptional regulator
MNPKYLEECTECKICNDEKTHLCPYCITQKVTKGKWKLLIFWHLDQGTKRFNELNRLIPCTQATLNRQLKELELDGVVHREVYTVIPPKVEYSLTTLGQEFYQVINSMGNWGHAFLKANGIIHDSE